MAVYCILENDKIREEMYGYKSVERGLQRV